MNDLEALHALARLMGVHTHYVDGLFRTVEVEAETLVRVCAALGAPISEVGDAEEALRAVEAARAREVLPPVLVAWEGAMAPVAVPSAAFARILLEDGGEWGVAVEGGWVRAVEPLPLGYHRLEVELGTGPSGGASGSEGSTGPEEPGSLLTSTVISAPIQSWRRPGEQRSWGVGTELAALRSDRSRSVGDLRDLESVCRWVGDQGGDLVTVLPLLPTFNADPPEPSPYSPVTRLFWSELILDLREDHVPTPPPPSLDVGAADREVRRALAGKPAPAASEVDDELARYARFRGAQARHGRNWREWPEPARAGVLEDRDVDPDEERFHRIAQTEARRQLRAFREGLEPTGVRLGLDVAVGVHPDGYDTWSHQDLFAPGMSVGAPPDGGFPSGQDWGFPPVLPAASRAEGHAYLAASIRHQARLAGVLRIDHVMAWTRLYWIPRGLGLHQGTYVSYPAEEMFAVLTLESVRNQCEIVGENLGTVPQEIREALPRHRIRGMYLAQFAAYDPSLPSPDAGEVAMIGTHDTPTFAGWIQGVDIGERVRCGLLPEGSAPAEGEGRRQAVERLAGFLGQSPEDRLGFLRAVLRWLGGTEAPLVIPWIEDLWLETEGVNLPGTSSAARPNWQRPMSRLLDDVFRDPAVLALVEALGETRRPG